MKNVNEKEVEMKISAREWKRLFYTGVGKSFSKTITEPITNSDSSYKRKYMLDDASGIVETALNFNKGERFDLSEAKKKLKNSFPERVIEVHVYSAGKDGRKARTIEIVDFAEGLSEKELEGALEYLAEDKEIISKGRPGRSLFGRGLSDVIGGHNDGTIFSYKDGELSKAEISFDSQKKHKGPKVLIKKLPALIKTLKDLHLKRDENGTCVRFQLNDDCHIPSESIINSLMSQFYMLRLINADPNTQVKLIRYQSKGKSEYSIDYDFPIGDVIEKFKFTIAEPIKGQNLPSIEVEAIVCRADPNLILPGVEAGEGRANGFLIVDDKDAVLDITLLPDFDKLPYLSGIFGIIRAKNIRETLKWYLDSGKDSALTVSRDGFDSKHEFTKYLFDELQKKLEPIYKKEEERFKKANTSKLSDETKRKIDSALKELNKFLKDVGEGSGDEDNTIEAPEPSKDIQFIPAKVRLKEGRTKSIFLYLKKGIAKPGGNILYDCENRTIEVTPLSEKVSDGKKSGDFLVFEIKLKCNSLHEKGILFALAEGIKGDLEARLEIEDVISSTILTPPPFMEFRPREAKGQPNRDNIIFLVVNSLSVPLGRKIEIKLGNVQGAIGLKDDGKKTLTSSVTFEKEHLKQSVGRIPIKWEGSAWGQRAKILAKTKLPGGQECTAEGMVLVEVPIDDGGLIKECRYVDSSTLPNKCSDLVDGILYISKDHYLNRIPFGADQTELDQRLKEDRTAQFRFASLIIEQAVFAYAEESIRHNKEIYNAQVPVTSIREIVDKKTNEWAPKIVKIIMDA